MLVFMLIKKNILNILFFSYQGIFFFSLAKYKRVKYEDYVYPAWAEAIGWMIALGSMLWIPGVAIFKVIKLYYTHGQLTRKVSGTSFETVV